MSNNLNRKQRRILVAKNKGVDLYFRVTPVFMETDGKLSERNGMQTYVMHTDPKTWLVVLVPAGAISMERAQAMEQELVEATKKDVMVLSDNVKFMRVEQLTQAEMAVLFPKQMPVVNPKVPAKAADASKVPA